MQYDVVIIGAGPAGSQTAFYLASKGYKVLILEKRAVIGEPVRCAEAAGLEKDLQRFFPISPDWMAGQIHSGYLIAPNGVMARGLIHAPALMVHRNKFDQFLVARAVKAGAELRLSAQAVGAERNHRGFRVSIITPVTTQTIETRFLVGADGTESQTGRWFGLYRSIFPQDIMTCLEYSIQPHQPVNYMPESLYFYLGWSVAPGGYAWVFPKNDGTFNVGVGLMYHPKRMIWPVDFLNQFINRNFKNFTILKTIAGGTLMPGNRNPFISDRVALVGDSAGHCNPLTGGGIMNALEASKLLATILDQQLPSDQLKTENLKDYPQTWYKTYGKTIPMYYRLKKIFYSLDDQDMNLFVATLSDILSLRNDGMKVPVVGKLFLKTLTRNPKLWLKLGKGLFQSNSFKTES